MCVLIYSCSARQVYFKIDQFEFDLKRNSSGRTQMYKHSPTPPSPPNNVLAMALFTCAEINSRMSNLNSML